MNILRPSRLLLAVAVVISFAARAETVPDFNEEVLPILASKCFLCHGPDVSTRKVDLRLDIKDGLFGKSREGIPIVKAGDLENSELWWRVAVADDPKDRMPPKESPKPLTDAERDVFRQWIEAGAKWEGHWAFEPLTTPAVPEVRTKEWVRNPVDAFVLAKLESMELAPSAEANRRTQIRRLTFDLHGLPPTPEETAVYLSDTSADAYEKLVDRLLASPRYGERWGRHWLDVAHYADTHGYDKDKRRENAWPYRDYVIRALNEDIPYGRFVEEQLAGDVLLPDDPQATVATGFIAAGPWDFVGHVELREGTVDKKITRLLDRDDMVSSAMNVFTSLTVQCARCHDHKFDPIAKTDYYALQANFAGVDRADRAFDAAPTTFAERNRLTAARRDLRVEMEKWRARLDGFSSPELDAMKAEIARLREERKAIDEPESPGNGYHSQISADDTAVKWVQVDLGAVRAIESLKLICARPTDFPDTPGFGFPVRFRIELSDDADFATSTVLVDQTGSDSPQRTDEPVRFEANGAKARYVRVTATKLWKRLEDYVFALAELEVYAGNENVALGMAVTAADSIDEGRWHTRYLTDGYDSRRRLGSAKPNDEEAKSRAALDERIQVAEKTREAALRAMLDGDDRAALASAEARLAETERALKALPKPQLTYAAAADFEPSGSFTPARGLRDVHVLRRGDVQQEGDLAAPGAVGCLPWMPARFDVSEEDGEGARRAALAQWISDPANALTWRSIVNRIWHYHFGRGIVDTPNDFGRMGSPPTHRDLLDWLAQYFLEHGQSMKALHRLIATSATYRQVSTEDMSKSEIDSSNRFLWRMNRRQLDAESLRDAVLYVSGKLDFTMGGPGFSDFAFEDDHSPRYLYDKSDPADPRTYRRSIYRFVVRSVPDPFMTSLDCADPSQSVPVRTQTLTAIQALALLNNPMVVRQAAYLAERVGAQSTDIRAQLDAAYQLVLNRPAAEKELDALVPYVEKHGMPAACRLILNTNEFIFVD